MSNLPDNEMTAQTAHAGTAVGLEKVTGTSYIVLQQNVEGDWGLMRAPLPAPNAEAAIRQAAKDVKDACVYVAIPARSWKPVRVSVETKSVVRLDDAF